MIASGCLCPFNLCGLARLATHDELPYCGHQSGPVQGQLEVACLSSFPRVGQNVCLSHCGFPHGRRANRAPAMVHHLMVHHGAPSDDVRDCNYHQRLHHRAITPSDGVAIARYILATGPCPVPVALPHQTSVLASQLVLVAPQGHHWYSEPIQPQLGRESCASR